MDAPHLRLEAVQIGRELQTGLEYTAALFGQFEANASPLAQAHP